MEFPQINFRLAITNDAPQVAAVVHAVYDEFGFTWEPDGYHADLMDLTDYCNPEVAKFWVAECEGVLVGCGGIEWHDVIPGPAGAIANFEGVRRIAGTSAEIIRMYVHPHARKRGIASEIMRQCVAEARLRNVDLVEIWSDKRFLDAHRLYERFGAVAVGDRICDDPDVSPEWGLALDLRVPSGN